LDFGRNFIVRNLKKISEHNAKILPEIPYHILRNRKKNEKFHSVMTSMTMFAQSKNSSNFARMTMFTPNQNSSNFASKLKVKWINTDFGLNF